MLSANPPVVKAFERILNNIADLLEIHRDSIVQKVSPGSAARFGSPVSTAKVLIRHGDPEEAERIVKRIGQTTAKIEGRAKVLVKWASEMRDYGNGVRNRQSKLINITDDACLVLEDAKYRIKCDLFMLQTLLMEAHADTQKLLKGMRADVECSPHPCCPPDENTLIEGEDLTNGDAEDSVRKEGFPRDPIGTRSDRDNPTFDETGDEAIFGDAFTGTEASTSWWRRSAPLNRTDATRSERPDAYRDVFAAEKQRLDTEKQRLDADRQQLDAGKQQLDTERKQLGAEKANLSVQKRSVEEEAESILAERARLLAEWEATAAEREQLDAEKANLSVQKRSVEEEAESIIAERANLFAEREAIAAERKDLSEKKGAPPAPDKKPKSRAKQRNPTGTGSTRVEQGQTPAPAVEQDQTPPLQTPGKPPEGAE